MKITESQLRKAIREELMIEMGMMKKPSSPIPIEELSFIPDSRGTMSLPGVGSYKVVKSVEEFENWKSEFIQKFGSGKISWNHNGWNFDNKNFQAALNRNNKMYLDYERNHMRRYGRKPNLGT